MNNRLLKFLPIAAALLMAVSCSRDDDGNAPASGSDGVQTVATNANTAKPIQIPFSITVGGRPSSLTKAQVVESESGGLTQKFSEGDVLIITGDGLAKDNPSVLTITPEGIDQETATFTGNLNLATGVALTSGVSRLTATLSNEKLGNEGKLLAAPVLVSDLEEAFEKYGYLVADFTYSDDDNPPQINLEQHTAFLVFDLPYTGEKVNVKIGDVTTPVFVSSKQVLAVPDGATVTSQRMSINLTIDLLFETPGEAVDVVFDIKRDLQLPDDCVPGLFSVSADKQVFFSKGNLQYNPKQNQWKFADNQYDYIGGTVEEDTHIGNVAGSTNTNVAGPWIDLFGWGTWLNGENVLKPYETQTNAPITYIWSGNSAIGEDWFTLSKDEWMYLFSNATRADKYGEGKVAGVNGIILFPDVWTYPTDLTSSTSAANFTTGKSAWSNTYTDEDWAKMEANGAVFLPAAGRRYDTDVYGDGYYWSSSANGKVDAYDLYFGSDFVYPNGANRRFDGLSVRLVRPL